MARLKDVPRVLGTVGIFGFAKRVYDQMSKDRLMVWASAMAYSWLFAVFPFFIFLMTLVPYLPGGAKDRVVRELKVLIYNSLPMKAAETMWINLKPYIVNNILNQPTGGVAIRVIGIVLALWAASGGMAMTMSALDRAYEVNDGSGGRSFYRHRLLALVLTVVVAALLLGIAILLPIGSLVKLWIAKNWITDPHVLTALDIARWLLAVPFMITLVAIVYYYGPSIRHKFNWLTPGALFCLVVWVVLGLGFRIYVDKFADYNKTYGTVGGVAVLLLFFYIDALVLLIGAEINSEIDFEVLRVPRGTRDFVPAEEAAEAVDDAGAEPPPLATEAGTQSKAPADDAKGDTL